MKIYLDDLIDSQRPVPAGWVGARNMAEFKKILEQATKDKIAIEAISFDHDLGPGEPEGYDIIKWLAEYYPELVVGETEIKVHSANPVGRDNIEIYIQSCKKHKEDVLAMKQMSDKNKSAFIK